MIVNVITKESLVKLRRQARRKRKEDHERFLNTTGREILTRDLSWNIADIAHSGTQHESERKGSVVPELPSDEIAGPYEDEADIRLLLFAQNAGAPVVINFGYKPSKRSEERLRQSAKIRGYRLHFYRLIEGNIAIEVESDAGFSRTSDARFLERLHIKPI